MDGHYATGGEGGGSPASIELKNPQQLLFSAVSCNGSPEGFFGQYVLSKPGCKMQPHPWSDHNEASTDSQYVIGTSLGIEDNPSTCGLLVMVMVHHSSALISQSSPGKSRAQTAAKIRVVRNKAGPSMFDF